jgi:anti-sigma factor RsiW
MNANPNIDELLCSYLDGELPPRQQTEVQRLVARDPEVGRRLRQLQNCKTLISALPRAQAPAEMLDQSRSRRASAQPAPDA